MLTCAFSSLFSQYFSLRVLSKWPVRPTAGYAANGRVRRAGVLLLPPASCVAPPRSLASAAPGTETPEAGGSRREAAGVVRHAMSATSPGRRGVIVHEVI